MQKYRHLRPRCPDMLHRSRDEPSRCHGSSTDRRCLTKNPDRAGTPNTREDQMGDKVYLTTISASPCPPREVATCGRITTSSTPYCDPAPFPMRCQYPHPRTANVPHLHSTPVRYGRCCQYGPNV